MSSLAEAVGALLGRSVHLEGPMVSLLARVLKNNHLLNFLHTLLGALAAAVLLRVIHAS